MSNIILEEKPKLYSFFKRVATLLIDILLPVCIFLLFIFCINNYSVNLMTKKEINNINEVYKEYCEDYNCPYNNKGSYGLYTIDLNAYLNDLVENQKYSQDAAMEKYNETYNKIDEMVSKDQRITNDLKKLNLVAFFHISLEIFMILFVFEFLIPLLNKYHQTIGMMLLKNTLVTKEDHIVISNIKVLKRFIFMFFLIYIPYVLLSYIGIIFMILLNIFFVALTKKRTTFHDAIIKAEIIDKEHAFLE